SVPSYSIARSGPFSLQRRAPPKNHSRAERAASEKSSRKIISPFFGGVWANAAASIRKAMRMVFIYSPAVNIPRAFGKGRVRCPEAKGFRNRIPSKPDCESRRRSIRGGRFPPGRRKTKGARAREALRRKKAETIPPNPSWREGRGR